MKATLLNPEACPKYCSRVITNIDNTIQTPQWMQKRLKRSGQQSHSPIVDITNYVLLELGQPMHAFDLEKIDGEIIVRKANQNEKLELLNGQTVELDKDTLVIADNKSAIAMAGIMGGESTSTQPDSTKILYEAAFFEPVNIAGKARSYGLHTESSLRFERGVDFELAEKAIERATELTLEICGGKAGPIQVEINNEFMPNPQPISISIEKIQTILGFDIDFDWATQKFQSLDFEIISATNSSWTIQP
ncbi:MAG: phenylalanine--tRNA ligase beta subunit-related protein, partial [Gammaproteobacteria bacterium]